MRAPWGAPIEWGSINSICMSVLQGVTFYVCEKTDICSRAILWAESIGNATETRGSRVLPARTLCER